jgi:hypothetical protein
MADFTSKDYPPRPDTIKRPVPDTKIPPPAKPPRRTKRGKR